MGCVCGKPPAIEDSRESPRELPAAASLVVSGSVLASEKLPALAAVPFTRRADFAVLGAGRNRGSQSNVERRGGRQGYSVQQQLPFIGNIPRAMEGEQVAAGWPAWLATVAGEAIQSWVPRRADSFEKLDKIGQGTYSNVYRARDIESGKIVALKKVRFDNLEPESVRFMAREIHILRRLDHPNIVKLKGLVTSRMSCSLYLIFEYMEHDLAGLASFPGIKFTEPQVKCYMQQLLCGLDHCHMHGVLHRDIKGSNLLIDNSGILKIADFGLASFFDPEQHHPLTSRVVTLWYRPPELLLGATNYGAAVDLWSTGCILAELYAGKPIMPGRTEVEQLHKIFKLCGSPSDDYWRKSKLPHATIFKPQQPYRRCVSETYKDFPATALALMEVLLSIDPADRGSAYSALKSEFFMLKPFACDPSSLPKYPPSKELDAKAWDLEARQGTAGGKVQKLDLERRGLKESRAAPAPDANAELSVSIKKWKGQANSMSRSEKFNPNQEEVASGFPLEPPRPTPLLDVVEVSRGHFTHRSSHSGPLVNRVQWARSRKSDNEALKVSSPNPPELSGLVAARRNAFIDGYERNNSQLESVAPAGRLSEFGIDHPVYDQMSLGGSHRKQDEDNHIGQPQKQGFSPKGSKIHYSGPLLRTSGNVDQVLKDHDRQIQQVFRRGRMDRSKARKVQGEGNQAGTRIKPYDMGVVPVYPSSRSSATALPSSCGAI